MIIVQQIKRTSVTFVYLEWFDNVHQLLTYFCKKRTHTHFSRGQLCRKIIRQIINLFLIAASFPRYLDLHFQDTWIFISKILGSSFPRYLDLHFQDTWIFISKILGSSFPRYLDLHFQDTWIFISKILGSSFPRYLDLHFQDTWIFVSKTLRSHINKKIICQMFSNMHTNNFLRKRLF